MEDEIRVLLTGMFIALFVVCFITYQIQVTNRNFIEKGYEQVQKVGSTDFLWTLTK